MAEAKPIGTVTHYFDKIMVAIVKASKPISVGDKLQFKGGKVDFTQEVGSMQLEHKPIEKAKAGEEFGVKVDQEVHDGVEVFKA